MSGEKDSEIFGRRVRLDEEDSELSRAVDKRRRKRERKELKQKEKRRRRRTKLIKKTLLYAVSIAIVGGLVYGIYLASISRPTIGPVGSAHDHGVLAVFLDDTPLDFSGQRFQVRDQRVHFEAGDGFKVHMHATGVTLGFFLNTLGITLDSDSLILYDGTEYVTQGDKNVKLYVNGVRNDEFGDYTLREQDQILISYGDESPGEIQRRLDFLSDLAARLLTPDN